MNLTFLLVVLAIVLSFPLLATAQPVYCGRGEYLTEENTCEPCKEGEFQDIDKHTQTYCPQCTKVDTFWIPGLSHIVDECTRFHDVDFRCVQGFFYQKGQKDAFADCKFCTNCSTEGKHLGQNCTETTDAICCDTKDEVVSDGTCVKPLFYCGPDDVLESTPRGREAEREFCGEALKKFEGLYCNQSCNGTERSSSGGRGDAPDETRVDTDRTCEEGHGSQRLWLQTLLGFVCGVGLVLLGVGVYFLKNFLRKSFRSTCQISRCLIGYNAVPTDDGDQ